MEIRIHINDRVANAVRSFFKRRIVLAAVLVAALTTVSYAAFTTFTPGTPISSSEVNGNFADLAARITALENAESAGPVTGYERIRGILHIDDGEHSALFSVTCSPGKKLVGGGHSAPFGVSVGVSAPLSDTAWTFQGSFETDLVSATAQVSVYAICVDVP